MFFYIFAVWNAAVFVLYGIDKYRATHGLWRISEKTLISCAFLMGAPGAVLGMKCFHHKTRKTLFRVLIPAALILNGAVVLLAERI